MVNFREIEAAGKVVEAAESAAGKLLADSGAFQKAQSLFSPTKRFERFSDGTSIGKSISQWRDGSTVTTYDGQLPFQFRGSKGFYASEAVQRAKPYGWTTLINQGGIERIEAIRDGKGTLAMETKALATTDATKWLARDYSAVARDGVPDWFSGDNHDWLVGQANLQYPTKATFNGRGDLMSLEYNKPTEAQIGPFRGLEGTKFMLNKGQDSLLTSNRGQEGFTWTHGTDKIDSWDGRRGRELGLDFWGDGRERPIKRLSPDEIAHNEQVAKANSREASDFGAKIYGMQWKDALHEVKEPWQMERFLQSKVFSFEGRRQFNDPIPVDSTHSTLVGNMFKAYNGERKEELLRMTGFAARRDNLWNYAGD